MAIKLNEFWDGMDDQSYRADSPRYDSDYYEEQSRKDYFGDRLPKDLVRCIDNLFYGRDDNFSSCGNYHIERLDNTDGFGVFYKNKHVISIFAGLIYKSVYYIDSKYRDVAENVAGYLDYEFKGSLNESRSRKINGRKLNEGNIKNMGKASTLPMLLKCINGIQKDNLNFSKIIGRDIYDIDYDNEDGNEIMEDNYYDLYREIYKSGKYYLYIYSDNNELGICTDDEIDGLIEKLAIKDGINCYKNVFGFTVVAYYGGHKDKLYLVPITDILYDYLASTVEESDFSESDTIDGLLSQHSY